MKELVNPIEIPRVKMLNVDDILPEPFKDVLVFGICPSVDDGYGRFYIARRWTGYNNADPYLNKDYTWLTRLDQQVIGVQWWMPEPIL